MPDCLVIVLAAACSFAVANGGYASFYYAIQTPHASTYYSAPIVANPPYGFGVIAPQNFYTSQIFEPALPFATFAEQPSNEIESATPIQQEEVTTPPTERKEPSNEIETSPPVSIEASPVPQNIETPIIQHNVQLGNPEEQFRGFAYHTQTGSGASTNVFFVTGPEAHQIKSLPSFNNPENPTIQKARKLASNSEDSNATERNQQEQINDILNAVPEGPAFNNLRSFFEHPQPGVQNFYSTNGHLFSKPVESSNLPANTVLLRTAIPLASYTTFQSLGTRFNENSGGQQTNATAKGEQTAGSEVKNFQLTSTPANEDTTSTAMDASTTETPNTESTTKSQEATTEKEEQTNTTNKEETSTEETSTTAAPETKTEEPQNKS